MSPTPKGFRAPFQLSKDENQNALVALQVLNVTVRGLVAIQTPAYALFVACADTLVESAYHLLDLARQSERPDTIAQAEHALRFTVKMLEEFVEAEIAKREMLTPGDIPGQTPTSGTIQ